MNQLKTTTTVVTFEFESLICVAVLTVGVAADTLGSEPPRNVPNGVCWLLLMRSVFFAAADDAAAPLSGAATTWKTIRKKMPID